jgi:hypothetical protein
MNDYTPEQVRTGTVWAMNVVDEFHLARRSLEHIRKNTRDNVTILCTDGNYDEQWEHIAQQTGSQLFYGQHWYGVESGGLVVDRLIRHTLSIEWMLWGFKIDPDTRVWRPLNVNPDPEEPILFGCPIGDGVSHDYALQGGCIGWTKAAARELIGSGILRSKELKDYRTWAGKNPAATHRAEVQKLTSFDWCLGWAARQLKIPMIRHPEIGSRWLPPPPTNREWVGEESSPSSCNYHYAVTHPHKTPADWE